MKALIVITCIVMMLSNIAMLAFIILLWRALWGRASMDAKIGMAILQLDKTIKENNTTVTNLQSVVHELHSEMKGVNMAAKNLTDTLKKQRKKTEE